MLNDVAIYSDNGFKDEINGFKAMKCNVKKTSRLAMSPIETGQRSIDNKVLDPIEVHISGYIVVNDEQSAKAVSKINAMYRNRSFSFYSVHTKDGGYRNLILQNAPHDEEAKMFDTVYYDLVFVEAMFIQGKAKGNASSDNDNFSDNGYTEPVAMEQIKE